MIDDIEDEEYKFQQFCEEDADSETDEYFGRGNAKKGYKEKYKRYKPSCVYTRLKNRKRVWDAFVAFTPT